MSIYPGVCGGYGITGPKGDPGENGSVLSSWRGAWNPDVLYMPGDLVLYEGSVYLLGGSVSVPTLYAMYAPEPPAAPWELFVQGAQPAHWTGFSSSMLDAQSGQNYMIQLGAPLAGSDTDWYTAEAERVVIQHSGLYAVSASVRLSLPEAPDPATPALRNFQITVNADPVASETVWTVGRSWGTTVTSPVLRLEEGAEIRFLVRQDSLLPASVDVNLSVTMQGT